MLSLRRASGQVPRCVRMFSGSATRPDLFDFFRRKGMKEQPVVQPKTKEVMKKIEGGEEAISSGRKKLRVLGSPPKDDSWEKTHNGFAVNAWPTNIASPELTESQITQALESCLGAVSSSQSGNIGDVSLADLKLRFAYTTAVSKELNLAIPDRILTSISTVADLQTYLVSEVAGRKFDERIPDAIYLDADEFEGTNITLRDAVAERRALKQRYSDALKAARAEQNKRQSDLLKEALN